MHFIVGYKSLLCQMPALNFILKNESQKKLFTDMFLLQENSQNAPLVHATLETLLRFLNWIPLGYIFETKLISTLIYKVI